MFRNCFEPFGSLRHAIKAAAVGGMKDENREYEDFRENAPGKRRYQLPDLESLELVYMAFDILYVDDHSITAIPLRHRHEQLRASIKDAPMTGIPMGRGLRGRVIPLIPDQTFLSGQLLSIQGGDLKDITKMMNKAILMQVSPSDCTFLPSSSLGRGHCCKGIGRCMGDERSRR